MARVEWSALSGDEVEAVVSNLLYHEHPRAVRVRPAQGDYGIDVLVPNESMDTVRDVYQIKKFALNLTGSQKSQIEKSFRRVLVGLVRENVSLGDWYLALPLDPTLDNLEWFEDMPDDVISDIFSDEKVALTEPEKKRISTWRNEPGRRIEWKGLIFCEALASRHWSVIDYYLHGGAQRIRSAVDEVAKLLQNHMQWSDTGREASTSILTPAETREHLLRLQSVLDGDPHFSYGVSIDPHVPALLEEANLVAATQEVARDGSCLTFRIYQRFSEALNERPVPIKLKFEFEDGSSAQQDFKEWIKYGKPVTVPVMIDADLPGGLGGSALSGTTRISPAGGGKKFERRDRIVTPDGLVQAEVLFSLSSTTGLDGTGVWIHGTDLSGVLSVEGTFDTTGESCNISFSMKNLAGHDPTLALPAIEFGANLVRPNTYEISGKYGPFHTFHEIQEEEGLVPEFVLRYVKALAMIQTRTPLQIQIPDLTTLQMSEAAAAIRAGSLIEGRTLVHRWTDLVVSEPGSDASFENDGHYELAVIQPLTVHVGHQQITLGATELKMLSAKISLDVDGTLHARPHVNNTVHETFAPEEPVPEFDRNPVRSRPTPPHADAASGT